MFPAVQLFQAVWKIFFFMSVLHFWEMLQASKVGANTRQYPFFAKRSWHTVDGGSVWKPLSWLLAIMRDYLVMPVKLFLTGLKCFHPFYYWWGFKSVVSSFKPGVHAFPFLCEWVSEWEKQLRLVYNPQRKNWGWTELLPSSEEQLAASYQEADEWQLKVGDVASISSDNLEV